MLIEELLFCELFSFLRQSRVKFLRPNTTFRILLRREKTTVLVTLQPSQSILPLSCKSATGSQHVAYLDLKLPSSKGRVFRQKTPALISGENHCYTSRDMLTMLTPGFQLVFSSASLTPRASL